MKNKNFFNRKGLKSFRSFVRDKATAAESTNQPPRPQIDLVISDFNCTAAAPPSKGGETFSTFRFYNSTLKLTPMPLGGLSELPDFNKSPLGDLGVSKRKMIFLKS